MPPSRGLRHTRSGQSREGGRLRRPSIHVHRLPPPHCFTAGHDVLLDVIADMVEAGSLKARLLA